MRDEVVKEYDQSEGIVPQLDDFALAWVEAITRLGGVRASTRGGTRRVCRRRVSTEPEVRRLPCAERMTSVPTRNGRERGRRERERRPAAALVFCRL